MNDLEREVLLAKTNEQRLDDLVEANRPWILKCAAEAAHRYVTDSDDEWSVALMAFSEAVQSYEADKGAFRAFAATVIRRRLVDHLRVEGRHAYETSVSPEAFSGELDEESATGLALEVQQEMAAQAQQSAEQDAAERTREEIAAAQQVLSRYGFSFFDLADCSPRTEKTKQSCAQAVRTLLADETLMEQMRRSGTLPMKELSACCGVPRKILDRHRRYIIAAAEILSGDYPVLSAYMAYIRRAQEA